MATSRNDPRITAAINTAMAWAKTQVGKATGNSVWRIAYPQWVGSGYHWCGGFVVAAYKQAGVDLMRCAWFFYTPYIKNFAVRRGFWKTGAYRGEYGDVALFDWQGDGVIDHTGLAWPDPATRTYRSIEGNTSRGTAGSQGAGGGCWTRYRSKPPLRGWLDIRSTLAWMIDQGLWKPSGTAAKPAPSKPAASGVLVVDGLWGPATTRALQKINKTTVDGVVSGQPIVNKKLLGGVSGWEFTTNPTGSQLIRAMQRAFGVTQDGFFGPASIRAMQKYYGTTVDGVISPGGSSVVMAMQRAINKQLGGK